MRRSPDPENAAVKDVAEFMAASARTAPKTRGIDNIDIIIIDEGSDKTKLINRMRKLSAKLNKPSMSRDADSIKEASWIVLIGVRSVPAGLDCGFCGCPACKDLFKSSGSCAYNLIDLGIAVGSAVSIASNFHIDNRVMYSIGKAAIDLGFFGKDVKQALGIPLSVTGKNPYFDRK